MSSPFPNAAPRPAEDADEMAAELTAWVRRESPTRDARAVDAMLDHVEAEVRARADGGVVAVERLPGRDGLGGTLRLRAGPRVKAAHVIVLSHLDTVHPLGTADGALPVRREGDRLYGPGAYDMKGGAYLALRAFLDAACATTLSRPTTYLLTPDEEIGSPTSREIIEAEARGARACLVTEPARDGGRVVTGRKGVGRFEARLTGRPSHSGSRHADGRSAIREAARQVLAVEAITDYARGVTTNVGLFSGGTSENTVPREARFTIDLRVVNAEDGAALERDILALRATDPDVTLEIRGGMNRPPMARTPATVELYEHARRCAAAIGLELGEVPLTGGGSDGNFTAAIGTPTLDGLGVDGDGAHTLGEFALVSSLVPRRRLMRALLESL